MIDIEADAGLLLYVDKAARNLSALDDARVEREIEATRARAEAMFAERGAGDVEAWFGADAIAQRLRVLIAIHRRRREAAEAARRAAGRVEAGHALSMRRLDAHAAQRAPQARQGVGG